MSTNVGRKMVEDDVIDEETMQSMLLQQLNTNRQNVFLRQGNYGKTDYLKVVVVRIPSLRKDLIRKEAIVLWTYRPRKGFSTIQTDIQPTKQWRQLVQLPKEVEACDSALISCTDLSPARGLEKLILQLFIRGYGGAAFKSSFRSKHIMSVATLVDIRQEPPHTSIRGCTPVEINKQSSHPAHRHMLVSSKWIDNEWTLPTIYLVQFVGLFGIDVSVPQHECYIVTALSLEGTTTKMIKLPSNAQTSEPCTIRLEDADTHLTAEALVKELVNLGYGTNNFRLAQPIPLPHILPCGGKVTAIIPRVLGPASEEPQDVQRQRTAWVNPTFEVLPFPRLLKSALDPFIDEVEPRMLNFRRPASVVTTSSSASFRTAATRSSDSYRTAMSTPASSERSIMSGPKPLVRFRTIQEDEPSNTRMPAPFQRMQSNYYENLLQQNILQPFDREINWSGKGQHVTFSAKEQVPLTVLSQVGTSNTAEVHKVLCRRIAIARKTMRCSSPWVIADALREVYHLQNLRHFHIVQLVGSYLQGRKFSILMYPVADCHLGTFLEETEDMCESTDEKERYVYRVQFLCSSLACLASAVAFVHNHTTKHMDIKPQNILVRNVYDHGSEWRIYLADFGLSRSFASQGHSHSDGPTSRTPRYCAPEVYQHERRGRSADIFSLGCVFIEIITVVLGKQIQDFADFRRGEGVDESFHANLPRVTEWLGVYLARDCISVDHSIDPFAILLLVKDMIHVNPESRPTAAEIQEHKSFQPRNCCSQAPEAYVAYKEPTSAPVPLPMEGATVKNVISCPPISFEDKGYGDDPEEHGRAKRRRISVSDQTPDAHTGLTDRIQSLTHGVLS